MPVLYLIINLSSAAPVLISVPSGVLADCQQLEQRVMVSPEIEFDELRLRTKGVAEKKDGHFGDLPTLRPVTDNPDPSTFSGLATVDTLIRHSCFTGLLRRAIITKFSYNT